MKICVISQAYPYPGIPQFTFVGEICKEMAAQGEEITVVAPQSVFRPIFRHETRIPFKYIIPIQNGKDIVVYTPKVLSVGNLPLLGVKINHYFVQHAISRTIRKHVRRDIEVFYGHFFFEGFHALPEAIRRNKPIIVASGETNVTYRDEYTKLLKKYLNQLKGIIFVSTKNKDEATAAGLTDGTNCVVLPNSVDSKFFYQQDRNKCRERLGMSNDDFIIAFNGYFSYRKGSRRVSDAITKLNDKHIKSIFIGRNEDGDDVEPNCDGIVFKGYMDHDKLPVYLCAADIFVLPTRAEGCCNAIVEALACGLPIISSDRNFNYDVLNEKNSILVDPDDVEAISKAIKTLKDDPARRESMSKAALEMAESLTIKERARRIISFIKQQIGIKEL